MAVMGPDGVFYGTSEGGYQQCPFGCGVVFSLTPPAAPGGAWTETVLHHFTDFGNHGYGVASIALGNGPSGQPVLYGTTSAGGANGLGTVFSLTPPAQPGGSWTETILHSFGGPPDAANPNTGLVIGNGGVLYGTTYYGGDASCYGTLPVGCGAVFSMTPPAAPGGAWTETVLHRFTGGEDGGIPVAGLTLGSDGVLYGTTTAYGGAGKYGTVFKLKP
jgi:uncharacterized repeat protein (TIGR03803 family)